MRNYNSKFVKKKKLHFSSYMPINERAKVRMIIEDLYMNDIPITNSLINKLISLIHKYQLKKYVLTYLIEIIGEVEYNKIFKIKNREKDLCDFQKCDIQNTQEFIDRIKINQTIHNEYLGCDTQLKPINVGYKPISFKYNERNRNRAKIIYIPMGGMNRKH